MRIFFFFSPSSDHIWSPNLGIRWDVFHVFPKLRCWNSEVKWRLTDGVSVVSGLVPVFWGLWLLKDPNVCAWHENTLKLNVKNHVQRFFLLLYCRAFTSRDPQKRAKISANISLSQKTEVSALNTNQGKHWTLISLPDELIQENSALKQQPIRR